MPKKNYTEMICLIDCSDSMESIKDDAIGGFNQFLSEQKKLPGTATVTLILFNNVRKVIYHSVDIKNIQGLSDNNYYPNGSTSLLDAIGFTVDEVGKRLAETAEEERPEKVMVCILSDGKENTSRFFTKAQIKEKVEHQQSKYNWCFAYLGADQDAFAEAGGIGIETKTSGGFDKSAAGVRDAYTKLSGFAATYRAS